MIYLNLLIIILLIIFIHELGHYSVARLFKTRVTDFSIGFGKVLYQKKDKNNTNWKVSAFPLGGYVKIKGLESIFKNTNKNEDIDEDSFQNLNLIKKNCILLAGSFFNIISAWLCLFCIFFFIGISSFSPIIGNVIEGSSADINDIQKGDTVISVNNKNIKYFSDISKAIKNDTKIKIDILRDNNLITKELNLKFNEESGRYIIGIMSTDLVKINKYDLLLSLNKSLTFIPKYYGDTFKYLAQSYNNKTLKQNMFGPIGMVKIADQLMLDKIKGILFIFLTISLFVGLFNLMPIPLLDGGHIVYFTLRSLFSDKLPAFITKLYLIAGITIISFLFIIITFNDIFNR